MRISVTFGGAGGIRVTLATRVVALAVALAEQRREFFGETARRPVVAGFRQPILSRGLVLPDVAAPHQMPERDDDLGFRIGEKAGKPGQRRRAFESFAFEPVEKLKQLVLSLDLPAWLVKHM